MRFILFFLFPLHLMAQPNAPRVSLVFDFSTLPKTALNNAFVVNTQKLLVEETADGIVRIFPLIPRDWSDVSFQHLVTKQGIEIAAHKENGTPIDLTLHFRKAGIFLIQMPFHTYVPRTLDKAEILESDERFMLKIKAKKGAVVVVENGYE
jgi:alpha-L-fucosidase 2